MDWAGDGECRFPPPLYLMYFLFNSAFCWKDWKCESHLFKVRVGSGENVLKILSGRICIFFLKVDDLQKEVRSSGVTTSVRSIVCLPQSSVFTHHRKCALNF